MTPARWQQVKETLASALEHETTATRADFLSQACADDTELHREVEALLEHSPDAFQSWADEGGFLRSDPFANNEGRRVGSYRLIRELGHGGMGSVWLATRADEEFEKTVAIKLLKRGTDTDEVLKRFRAERQILAHLEHPGIARLFDGGVTEDGLPYFVMEHVAGARLTDFVRDQHLSLGKRLELFRKVCAAVQFAHQNLIVHRDLKPANILVTPSGEPKLLDFGIAKLLTPGAEAWEMTLAGRERLTPAYASPEQVRGEPITTATDVYSLGALLYEILCERQPHSFSADHPSPTELLRIVCQTEPPRPSLAASTPERRRALRGDLETIILRAMAKAPARRYVSVDQFSADLRRYLEGLPVRARKDTLPYRGSKFVRRNKIGVAVAALVGLTLVAGIIGTTFQRNRAQRLLLRAEKGDANNRQLLYAAQMSLAYQAWESANVGRALDLLEAQRPSAGREDLRGFEWYLLWRLVHEGSHLLPGPTTPVHSVAFSRDGRRIAGVSVDGKAYVWDATSRELLISFDASPSQNGRTAFTPDGNFLFTGGADGSARLWSVESGGLVRLFAGHKAQVWCVALSPDGRTVATASLDGTAKLWNLARGEELVTLRGHTDAVSCVAFSPDGGTIATTSRDHTAKLWNVATGEEIATLQGHTWWVLDAAFSPDGTTLATTGSDGDTRLWNAADHRETGIIRGDGGTVATLGFSPDGKFLATGDLENKVKIYELATGQLADVLRGHLGFVYAVAFSPNGKSLASGGEDHSVRLWELNHQSGGLTLAGHDDWVWDIAFSPDGQTLATASKDASVKLWNVTNGRETMTLKHPLWVNSVRFSADGNRLATACDDSLVRLWDPRTGANVLTLRGHDSIVESVAFSPESKLLASGSKNGEIKIRDVANGRDLATFHSPDHNLIWSLAFSPDGKHLAAAEGGMNDSGSETGHLVTIWELSSGRMIATLRSHSSDVRALAFAPVGQTLATGSVDGTIKLWSVPEYREIVTLKTQKVQSLAFSSDGKRLVSAGLDKTVKLWDVATRQELCTLTEPSLINAVAFSPNNNVLAVAGTDHKVRLWFAATKDEADGTVGPAPNCALSPSTGVVLFPLAENLYESDQTFSIVLVPGYEPCRFVTPEA